MKKEGFVWNIKMSEEQGENKRNKATDSLPMHVLLGPEVLVCWAGWLMVKPICRVKEAGDRGIWIDNNSLSEAWGVVRAVLDKLVVSIPSPLTRTMTGTMTLRLNIVESLSGDSCYLIHVLAWLMPPKLDSTYTLSSHCQNTLHYSRHCDLPSICHARRAPQVAGGTKYPIMWPLNSTFY